MSEPEIRTPVEQIIDKLEALERKAREMVPYYRKIADEQQAEAELYRAAITFLRQTGKLPPT